MNPRVSVIIPSYNSAATIERVLKGVLDQPPELLEEVIIVDSSDDTRTRPLLARYEAAPVRILYLAEKSVPARARNIGAAKATGELLVFLDSDAAPAKDWLAGIVAAYQAGRRVGGGSVEIPEFQEKKPIALAQFFLQFNEFMAFGVSRRKEFSPSCNLFCEKKLFEEVGGFSEIRAAEDVLFGLKVGRVAEYWFVPGAKVWHIFRERIHPFLNNQMLLGKYVLIHKRLYYGNWYYRGFLPALLVLPVIVIKILRILWRVISAGSLRHIFYFLISLPFFLLGLIFWGAGFFQACFAPSFSPEPSGVRNGQRKKILFITNLLPYPLDNGGKIRTFNTIRVLRHFCDIDLVSFIDRSGDARFIPDMLKMVAGVECIYKKILLHREPWAFAWQALKSMFHPYPYIILKYSSDPFKQLVRRKLSESSYDAIYIDHLQLFQYVPPALLEENRSKVILDQHNVESDIVKSMIDNSKNPVQRMILNSEYRKLLNFEANACRQAGQVLAITEQNRLRFLEMTGGACRCAVAPFFIENSVSSAPAGVPEKVMLFLGTMSWFPNREGVLWFYEHVFKKHALASRGWKFLIVGNGPGADILRLAKDPAVEVTGYVEDVRPYVKRAMLGIVPLHIRAGLRIKILELMAFGVPVVSTSVAAEGIPVKHLENIWLANDEEGFLQAFQRLAEEADLRRRLVENALDLVAKGYSLPYAMQQYSELFG